MEAWTATPPPLLPASTIRPPGRPGEEPRPRPEFALRTVWSQAAMSMSVSVQVPRGVFVTAGDDARGPSRPGRARSEPREPDSSFALACRDVIDEVRLRMKVRGYQ